MFSKPWKYYFKTVKYFWFSEKLFRNSEKWFRSSEKWFESLKSDLNLWKNVVCLWRNSSKTLYSVSTTYFQSFNFIINTVSEYAFWHFSPCVLFCVSFLKPCKLLTCNKGFKTLKVIFNPWKYFLQDSTMFLKLK